MNELELRMYFFVPYNISEIQKGIQAGHASLEYAHKYGDTKLFKDFIKNHKTWIILNGGTTNENLINPGSLQILLSNINFFNANQDNGRDNVEFSTFNEPDLNDALSAICFICDERVWNYRKYPDFDLDDYLDETSGISDTDEALEIWKKTMGGDKNIFLRDLIKRHKLA